MKILVCIKQVPGSNQVEVDPVTGVLKRSGIPNVSNVLSVDSFIKYAHELAAEFGVRIPSFGHAGDGNLHVYICRDALADEPWEQVKADCFDKMYQKAVELGGRVSGEHGIGYAKKDYLRRQYGPTPIALMQGIKKVSTRRTFSTPARSVSDFAPRPHAAA